MGCVLSRGRKIRRNDAPSFREYVNHKAIDLELIDMPGHPQAKNPEMNSFFGKAGVVGLEKAVEVLDTIGSSLSNLNPGNAFIYGTPSRGHKISILAFEIANTIAKGSSLMQSLSKDDIHFLNKEILPSQGLQFLVSKDTTELLRIAAADKRDEFRIFSMEIARFGDLCKNPQWHHLTRYFQKLHGDPMPLEKLREEAETAMRELLMLAQHTSELYHELQALDKFQQDYRQRLREEESLLVSERGDGLVILGRQLRNQRKIVSNLKKKSLWSRSLEEIVEKLVEVVEFLHKEISTAFGFSGMDVDYAPVDNRERLGVSGLALHYANVIKRIEVIVSRPISMPSNARNMLYNGLPMSVKAALRSRLQSYAMEQLTTSQLKVEIQKILQWMVPMAENTIKAHQGFGWVGEWANMGTDVKSPNVPRILTLYHAEKEKTDEYILQLVVWLHHLVVQIKETGYDTRSPQTKNPLSQKTFPHPRNPTLTKLSEEDRKMLERVGYGRLVLGRSKSHGYQAMKMRPSKKRLCRSWSSNSLLETRLPSMRKGLDEIDSSLDVFSSGILTYT